MCARTADLKSVVCESTFVNKVMSYMIIQIIQAVVRSESCSLVDNGQ
jgi:hypothetical protein